MPRVLKENGTFPPEHGGNIRIMQLTGFAMDGTIVIVLKVIEKATCGSSTRSPA